MSMRLLGLAFTVVAAGLWAEEPAPAAPAKSLSEAAKALPDKLAGKPLAFIPLVAEAPKELKGDLSDAAWEKSATLNFVSNQSADEPKFKTVAKAFCTQDAFYLGVQFDDPDPDNPKIDGAIWERDGLEFFIFPGEDLRQKLYYQAILDQSNQVQFFHTHIYPKHNNHAQSGQWTPSIQTKTVKSKSGWSAEMRIAFDDVSPPKAVLEGKSLWRMALYRNRPARGEHKAQSYGWSPTLGDSYHCSWKFGYVVMEQFATVELIQQILERKKKEGDKEAAITASDPVKTEIKALVVKLGHDVYQERTTAHERLAALTADDRAAETFAEETLRAAERESDDAEVRSRARKLLAGIRERKSPDEDPLPGNQSKNANIGFMDSGDY